MLDPLEAADDGLGGDYNRFGDFKMPTSAVAGGQEVAILVKLNRMYIDKNEDRNNGCPVRGSELPDLSMFENEVRYLGPPEAFDNNEFDAPKFIAAELQCTPFVRDWSPAALAADFSGDVNTDTIYYYGAEVVPCSIHAVQQGTQACVESGNPEDCLSDPLEVRTALWGDIWPPFGGYREPQLFDVAKMRAAVKGLHGGPSNARSTLRGNVVQPGELGFFSEFIAAVERYERLPYSEVGPSSCTVTTLQMGAEVAEIAELLPDHPRSTSKRRREWPRSTAPVCGDSIIEWCEQCDDGNTNPNDGCDADCRCECDENCPGEEGATAYFKLVPVSPQGLDSLPYPNCQGDSCISGSTITLPSGERQVWLEVRLGGWGNLVDVTGWQAVLDASSFCSGTGDPLQTFRPECEDDQCVCRQVNDDGGAPCNKYPNLFPDTCEPGFQQFGQETFAFLGIAASDNSGENIRSLAVQGIVNPPGFDLGKEFYGATWVLNIPAGAAGTYTIGLNACGESIMISGDFLIPIDSLEPAVIVIEDAVVAGAGPADALVRASNLFGLANGERMNRVGAFKMPASYVAGAPESVVAIRVEIVDLYIDSDEDAANGCPVRDSKLPDLSAFNGQVRYLGPPSTLAGIIAAELQCTPFYRDWSPAALTADFPRLDTSTIYYYGAAVLPCSVYEARYGEQGGELSQALEIRTALWGDVWPPFGIVNFTDIGSVVNAFKFIEFIPGCPPKGAPRKFQAMLRENSVPLGSTINFTDIGNVVRAFKTIAYAEDGPTACP